MEMINKDIIQIGIPVGKDLSKVGLHDLAIDVVDRAIKKGNYFEVAETVSALEYLIKQIKEDKDYKEAINDMLHLHKGKFETPSGGKIETMEGGTKYHYENCNDPIYQELLIEQDKLNERIKSRELFLKTIPVNGMDIRHEDELVTIFPPYKTSTTTYKVTLAK